MPMFCTQCGQGNADDANFCESCGAPLTSSSGSQRAAPPRRVSPQPAHAPSKRNRRVSLVTLVVIAAVAMGGAAALLVPGSPLPGVLAKLGVGPPFGGSDDETLFYVGQNGKWGYVDRNGSEVIPLQFDSPPRWEHPQAPSNWVIRKRAPYPVAKGRKWVLVDRRGKELGPWRFEGVRMSVEDEIVCGGEGKAWGCVNSAGTLVVPFSERGRPVSISEGLIRVMSEEKKYGFLNSKGETIVPPSLTFAWDFVGGLACVKFEDGMYGLINREGKEISKRRFKAASNPGNGLWPVSEDGTKWALADLTGQIVHSLGDAPGGAGPYQDGLLWFSSPDRKGIGYWDQSGRVVIRPQFSSPSSFKDGVASVSARITMEEGAWRPWGFVRKDGTFLVPPIFEYVSDFFDGVASVRKGNDVWLIDAKGRPFWPKGVPAIEGARSDIQQLAGWTWRVAKSTHLKDGTLGAIIAFDGDRIKGIELVGSRERAGGVKFERTSNPGVVRVLAQSGQALEWQFIVYGEDVVFINEQQVARLLTRVAQRETAATQTADPNKPQAAGSSIFSALPSFGSATTESVKGELTRPIAAKVLANHLANAKAWQLSLPEDRLKQAMQEGLIALGPYMTYIFTEKGLAIFVGGIAFEAFPYSRQLRLKAPLAEKLEEVTGITAGPMPGTMLVEFTTAYIFSPEMRQVIPYVYSGRKDTAVLRKFDDGWRVEK